MKGFWKQIYANFIFMDLTEFVKSNTCIGAWLLQRTPWRTHWARTKCTYLRSFTTCMLKNMCLAYCSVARKSIPFRVDASWIMGTCERNSFKISVSKLCYLHVVFSCRAAWWNCTILPATWPVPQLRSVLFWLLTQWRRSMARKLNEGWSWFFPISFVFAKQTKLQCDTLWWEKWDSMHSSAVAQVYM